MNLKDKRLNKKYIQLKSGETLHQTLCHPVKLNTDTNKEKKTEKLLKILERNHENPIWQQTKCDATQETDKARLVLSSNIPIWIRTWMANWTTKNRPRYRPEK